MDAVAWGWIKSQFEYATKMANIDTYFALLREIYIDQHNGRLDNENVRKMGNIPDKT